MIKIAERAGANLVVMGTYRIAGEGRDSTIAITARVIDIREGRLVGKEYNRGGPLVDLQKLQGDLAYEILYQHNQALPYSRDQIVIDATMAPIGAYENFIKGTLTRDREARVGFLERAIKEYAEKTKGQYLPAIFELGRVHLEAGEYKVAAEELSLVNDKDPRYDEASFYVGVAQDLLGKQRRRLTRIKNLNPAASVRSLQQHRCPDDQAQAVQRCDQPSEAGRRCCSSRYRHAVQPRLRLLSCEGQRQRGGYAEERDPAASFRR